MIGEELLIVQCKNGVPIAQRKMYDLYKSKWFMICLRYIKKRKDALDALQNAFVQQVISMHH